MRILNGITSFFIGVALTPALAFFILFETIFYQNEEIDL
jgi:hypothetical protein